MVRLRVALFVWDEAAPYLAVIRPVSDSVALTFQGIPNDMRFFMGKKFNKKTQGDLVETPWVKKESLHGSQRENAVIAGFLASGGWNRHTTPQVYGYLLPKVEWVGDGNGCGRGTTFLDAFRIKGGIAHAVSLKCPKDSSETRSIDLFRGTKETMIAGIIAMRNHSGNSKKIPLAVVRSGGETFAPELTEWSIRDLCQLVANPGKVKDWLDEWAGVPVRPNGWRHPGRGGNPCEVWIAECPPDKYGNVYWRLTASTRKFSWTSGTAADLANQIDQACR